MGVDQTRGIWVNTGLGNPKRLLNPFQSMDGIKQILIKRNVGELIRFSTRYYNQASDKNI